MMYASRLRILQTIIVLFTGFSFWATASPGKLSLHYVRTVDDILVYKDAEFTGTYYYSPGKIILATGNAGEPDLKFLQMRYSGSQATGDAGVFRYKSLLQFRVRFREVGADRIQTIRSVLNLNADAKFSPLPIHHVKAFLVYASVEDTSDAAAVNGFFESEDDLPSEKNWNEKTFTVSLDNETSQIFWNALEKGNTIISMGYEYYADCTVNEQRVATITGSKEITNALNEQLSKDIAAHDTLQGKDSPVLVYADASEIYFDSKKYPGLLVKVDINESRIPPDFAILEVRCYDFDNKLRDDLYAKRIEVEATGMNHKTVKQHVTFYKVSEGSYCRSIKFPYAVRMNLPYRYRVVEIKDDGAKVYSAWTTGKNWVNIVDITGK